MRTPGPGGVCVGAHVTRRGQIPPRRAPLLLWNARPSPLMPPLPSDEGNNKFFLLPLYLLANNSTKACRLPSSLNRLTIPPPLSRCLEPKDLPTEIIVVEKSKKPLSGPTHPSPFLVPPRGLLRPCRSGGAHKQQTCNHAHVFTSLSTSSCVTRAIGGGK